MPIIAKLRGAKFVAVKSSQMPTEGTPLESAQHKQAWITGNAAQNKHSRDIWMDLLGIVILRCTKLIEISINLLHSSSWSWTPFPLCTTLNVHRPMQIATKAFEMWWFLWPPHLYNLHTLIVVSIHLAVFGAPVLSIHSKVFCCVWKQATEHW